MAVDGTRVSGSQLKRREKMEAGANDEMERILIELFHHVPGNNVPICATILTEKARETALRLNIENL